MSKIKIMRACSYGLREATESRRATGRPIGIRLPRARVGPGAEEAEGRHAVGGADPRFVNHHNEGNDTRCTGPSHSLNTSGSGISF